MKTESATVATSLSGDWTMNGITGQVNYLMSISGEVAGNRINCSRFVVDCSGINQIDMSGLQLLYVWLQCLQLKGMHAELVNFSDDIRATVQQVGLHKMFEAEQDRAAA